MKHLPSIFRTDNKTIYRRGETSFIASLDTWTLLQVKVPDLRNPQNEICVSLGLVATGRIIASDTYRFHRPNELRAFKATIPEELRW